MVTQSSATMSLWHKPKGGFLCGQKSGPCQSSQQGRRGYIKIRMATPSPIQTRTIRRRIWSHPLSPGLKVADPEKGTQEAGIRVELMYNGIVSTVLLDLFSTRPLRLFYLQIPYLV